MEMEGINYVTDDQNRKIAVQINLTKYGDLWEDFYDGLIADLRKEEEKIPLNEVITFLKKISFGSIYGISQYVFI